MNRFAHKHECGRCGATTVYPTLWTRFTNIFKKTRTIEVRSDGPTPGIFYPGEKVKFRWASQGS